MKIGIVLRYDDEKLYVNISYINYIKNMNYEYEFIDSNSNLEDFDLLILPGGYDINPIYYNEINTTSFGISEYNDNLDFKVIDYCLNKSIPLIGICRGMQSIAVRLGCTLYQDIENHKSNNHFIKFNNKYILVNSYHHQAIKEVPNYIEVLAKSLDNNIEIIKYKNIIGIQFHPEKMNYSLSSFNLKLSH